MGLFNAIRNLTTSVDTGAKRHATGVHTRVEQLEPRQMLSGDGLTPDDVLLGGVYFEQAAGEDNEPNILQVSFEGGAAGTVLNRVTISGDRDLSGDLSLGDAFFDTEDTAPGDNFGPIGFTLVSSEGFEVTGVSFADGGTDIVFDLEGFEAGETLVFTIDVDEFDAVDPQTGDPSYNSVVEGAEFQFSTLTGEFSAPGFVDLTLSAQYFDFFDSRRAEDEAATGLELSLPDDVFDPLIDRPDRSAGADAFAPQVPLASISGYVYHDRSDDGVYDRDATGADTEEPIAGVRIELLDANGDGLGVFTTTNENGYYEFLDLTAGTYGVREAEQPEPYYDGKDAEGSNGGVAGNDIITGAVLNFGDRATEYNFGELLGGSIAGRVHADTDGDCDFDDPDVLLEGVVIELLDGQGNVIRTTTTDDQGRYKFENLRPGEYRVREIQPTSYNGRPLYDGTERAGSVGGDVSDDLVAGIVIGSGVDAVNYDFCEHLGASLSGYVYHDQDDNGVYTRLSIDGSDEDPIADVGIKLLDATGATIATATTDVNGFYQFTDLDEGKYTVMETQPTGWIDGKDTPGSTGGDASVNDMISEIMIMFGADSKNNNFGELLGGSIAGRVHADTDGDCDFDDPDVLLEGVVIELLDQDGNVLRTTETDADGRYKFDGLAPGVYSVREIQPTDLAGRPLFDGDERAGDAGGDVSNDLVTGIVIGSGQDAVDYDFCEHLGQSLSGFVYHDENDDGVFDPGETPIEGVAIKLLDDAGETIATTTTDALGFYEFTDLDIGKYTVMETQPDGWLDGKDTAGSTGGDVSVNDMISQVMIMFGTDSVQNNFGELLGASVGGRVHASNDPDCDYDDPDVLLEGVKMELLNASGEVVATTTTDANGQYLFSGLRPGEYSIREVQPASYQGRTLFDGSELVGEAGGVATDDLVSGIVLESGDNALGYHFCEHFGATLSGFVYHDQNDDGTFAATEDPIAGVTLRLLLDGVDTSRIAVTDATGFYEFTDLTPGKYTVVEEQPDGWYDGKDTPGTLGGDASTNDVISEIMLDFGDNSQQNNFGELLGGSIAGRIHADPEGDCIVGEDDLLLEGVTVQLLDDTGAVIATTTTDENGEYEFTNLRPGSYSVQELQPEGYFNLGSEVGSGGGVSLTLDLIGDIVVGSGEALVDYNFCETPPAQLSGYVFIDGAPIPNDDALTFAQIAELRNGTRTDDDTPLEGVTVELRNGISGDPIFGQEALPGVYPDGPITAQTDSSGFYQFIGLPAGVYAVVEIQPEDLIDGVDTPGSLGGFAVVEEPVPAFGQIFTQTVLDTIDRFYIDFGPDALVRIALSAGQNSVENNFSEVRQQPDLPPPELPPSDPPAPPVFTTPSFVPQTVLPPLAITPVTPDPIFGGSSRALGWTWHLSVVNAGWPREVETSEAEMVEVSARLNSSEWRRAEMDRAAWLLMEDDQRPEDVDELVFGNEHGIPVSGDWDGDGDDEIGVFIAGYWYLDLNDNGRWDAGDLWAKLGSESDLPITGDWDGDGKTDIGIFGPAWPRDPHAIAHEPGLPDAENHPTLIVDSSGTPMSKNLPPTPENATSGARLLRKTISGRGRADVIDHVFHYGTPGDTPIAGDWNGDGIRTIGVYRDGAWQLDTDGDGRLTETDETYRFGSAGDLPAVGDWNGDGIDDLGVFTGGEWVVDSNGNRELDARDTAFGLGDAGDQPIVGDWDGDGVDEPGVYSPQEPAPEVRVSQKAG